MGQTSKLVFKKYIKHEYTNREQLYFSYKGEEKEINILFKKKPYGEKKLKQYVKEYYKKQNS